jgi:hypothetical protein
MKQEKKIKHRFDRSLAGELVLILSFTLVVVLLIGVLLG